MKLTQVKKWAAAAAFGGVFVLFATTYGAAFAAEPQQQGLVDAGKPLHLTAIAANLGSMNPNNLAQRVDIAISRWSTNAQRQSLLDQLKENGEQGLLKALQKQPSVGTIKTPDSLGYDLRYAQMHPFGDSGRRIVIATDRPIRFWEAANQTRTLDYPFTVIELHLDKDGKGEGKMSVATKISIEGDTLVLENYASQPVMLNDVRIEK